jgi:hypothetical protein
MKKFIREMAEVCAECRDKITAEVIRRYIQHHRTEKAGDSQLNLFE